MRRSGLSGQTGRREEFYEKSLEKEKGVPGKDRTDPGDSGGRAGMRGYASGRLDGELSGRREEETDGGAGVERPWRYWTAFIFL